MAQMHCPGLNTKSRLSHPGEKVGCQAIDGVVSHLDCLLDVLELEQGDGWTKGLLLVDLQGVQMAAPEWPSATHDGTLQKPAFCSSPLQRGQLRFAASVGMHDSCPPVSAPKYAVMLCYVCCCAAQHDAQRRQHSQLGGPWRTLTQAAQQSLATQNQNTHTHMPHRHVNGALIQDSGAEEVALVQRGGQGRAAATCPHTSPFLHCIIHMFLYLQQPPQGTSAQDTCFQHRAK